MVVARERKDSGDSGRTGIYESFKEMLAGVPELNVVFSTLHLMNQSRTAKCRDLVPRPQLRRQTNSQVLLD